MPNIPAYCERCKLWHPSGFFIDKSDDISLDGNIDSCPSCSGPSRLENGVYTTVEGAMQVVRTSNLNREHIQKLNEILRDAIKNDIPAHVVRDRISNEVSGARSLNQFVNDRQGIFILLNVILAFSQIMTPILPYILPAPSNPETQRLTEAIKSLEKQLKIIQAESNSQVEPPSNSKQKPKQNIVPNKKRRKQS